jgi:2-polyprenyl-3-methyl-5-hydroxy-6-metoxy-1,4-benzoquinol methylase
MEDAAAKISLPGVAVPTHDQRDGSTATPSEGARSGEYSEYFEARRPIAFGEQMVRWWHRRMFRQVAGRIADFRRGPILEVGAGWGYFADVCRDEGTTYSGIELNGEQAAKLRQRGHDVVQAAVPPMPVGPECATVWMSHVLEHAVDYLHALSMVKAVYTRLRPGGHVVVIAPDLYSSREEFWSSDWSHGFPTTSRRVAQLLSEAGFAVVHAGTHTCSFTNPAADTLVHAGFQLLPHRTLDLLAKRAMNRTLFYSFMTVFGWRQILVIARKA